MQDEDWQVPLLMVLTSTILYFGFRGLAWWSQI